MTKRTYTIYALTDPRDNGVRYIGITVNPDERLKQHIWGDINLPKRDWIRELNQSGLAPIMCSIETAETEGEALEREAYWIQQYLSKGVRLVNILMTPYTNTHALVGIITGRVTLDALITESGLRKKELADQSGVDVATIIRIGNGKATTRVTVVKLVRVLEKCLDRSIDIDSIEGLNINK